jgi:hypothetical protein
VESGADDLPAFGDGSVDAMRQELKLIRELLSA